MLGGRCAIERVNQVDDNSQRWKQGDQEEYQWIRPRRAGKVLASNPVAHTVEYDDGDDLEDVREQWHPCLVVLVRVRDRFRELCSELEDDESHDKPDHEYSNVRDRNSTARDVLRDTWKAEHNCLDNHQYDDARDQSNERRHDWSKRSPRAVRAA